MEQGRNNNITHIKVPLYQVLSYDYHILLSQNIEKHFNFNWNKDVLDYMEFLKEKSSNSDEYKNMVKKYEYDKMWYDHLVNREDQISYNKTENLAKLFMFMSEIGESNINGLPLEDTLYLDISLAKNKEISR